MVSNVDCKGKDKGKKVCNKVDKFVGMLVMFLSDENKAYEQR